MSRGTLFHTRVSKALDLDDADVVWLQLLDEVCAQLDLVERIEANVADRPLTTTGSTGQEKPDGLLAELRQQRLALSRLLLQLGIDDKETQSQRQSRVARKRYGR